MHLIEDTSQGKYKIRNYSPGKVTINDDSYTKSILVSMTDLQDWQPQSFDELTSEHFQIIADQKPQIVLLGTGEHLRFPSQQILSPLTNINIGVEVMNTAAACRTFNVLTAEGRNVIAALLL